MHWCLGMYGSASTWAFYVVQKLAAVLVPERPVMTRFLEHVANLEADGATLIVKTHAAPVHAEIAQNAQAIIITMRDPRDSLASMIAHNKVDYDLALELVQATAAMCLRYAHDPRAVALRFEDRFYDNPATIDRLAATFGRPLARADRDRIFAETRREAVEQFIASLDTLPTVAQLPNQLDPEDRHDLVTGWHKHHAGRKGEVGRWRQELAETEVAGIEDKLREWMRYFGYKAHTLAPLPYALRIGQYRADI